MSCPLVAWRTGPRDPVLSAHLQDAQAGGTRPKRTLDVHPAEVFCGDDGGGGPYWLVAEGLTALDAAEIVWTFDSLMDGFTVALVSGRVEGEGEDRRVTLDEDGPVDLWEVERQ